MKPPRTPDSSSDSGIREHLEKVSKVLSNISFGTTLDNADKGKNIDCWKASGTAPVTPNTEFSVAHGLGRVPITLAGQDTNNGGVIYRSTTAWTKTAIFLKCTVASSVYNIVVI